jgi:transposase-like protein
VLVTTDGAPGLIRAVEEVLPRSLRQRCLAHKIRNLQSKVPEESWREVKARALAAYQAASPMLAELAKEEFVKRFERELPAATACFLDDFAACIAQLRLPIAHRRAIRTTDEIDKINRLSGRRSDDSPPGSMRVPAADHARVGAFCFFDDNPFTLAERFHAVGGRRALLTSP